MINSLLAHAFSPDDASDWFRYLAVLFVSFLIGTDATFILQAKHLFPQPAIRFWRLFFIGKIALASYIVISLLHHGSWWRGILVWVGAAITIFALTMVWYDRPYRYMVVQPNLLDEETKARIRKDLKS